MSAGSDALAQRLEKALKASQAEMLSVDTTEEGSSERREAVRISATVWYEIIPDESKKPVLWTLDQGIKMINSFRNYIATLAPMELVLTGEVISRGSTKNVLSTYLVWKGSNSKGINKAGVTQLLNGFGLERIETTLPDFTKSVVWTGIKGLFPWTEAMQIRALGFPNQIEL